ncbi:hypothetical protein IWX47DRAFT_573613 [Phyllosticta citricarpa]
MARRAPAPGGWLRFCFTVAAAAASLVASESGLFGALRNKRLSPSRCLVVRVAACARPSCRGREKKSTTSALCFRPSHWLPGTATPRPHRRGPSTRHSPQPGSTIRFNFFLSCLPVVSPHTRPKSERDSARAPLLGLVFRL